MKRKTLLFFTLIIALVSCNNTRTGSGTVKGELCYPSEYLPSMKVILKNNETGEIQTLVTKEGDQKWKMENVPIGHYVAYAYTTDKGTSQDGGGFTNAIPCGLSIDCKDHSLIEFEVKQDETVNNIEICDWYGAILPSEK